MRRSISILIFLLCSTVRADGIDELRKLYGLGVRSGFNVTVSMDVMPAHVAAQFTPAFNAVEVNLRSEYWSDPEQSAYHAFFHQWFSTDRPEHIGWHEAGHARMFRFVGAARMDELSRTPVDLGLAYVSWEVSIYAAVNRAEFFAEVYAGLMAGRKFPADIMTRYNSLWR